jgi:hypothetical protein
MTRFSAHVQQGRINRNTLNGCTIRLTANEKARVAHDLRASREIKEQTRTDKVHVSAELNRDPKV